MDMSWYPYHFYVVCGDICLFRLLPTTDKRSVAIS